MRRQERPLSSRECQQLRFLMKQLRVPAVAVSISPESSRDIAVYGGKIPHIICGRKWIAADFDERLKRMTHELLHLNPGLRHNASARRMGYYSKPERDTFTKRIYKMLTNPHRNPEGYYA